MFIYNSIHTSVGVFLKMVNHECSDFTIAPVGSEVFKKNITNENITIKNNLGNIFLLLNVFGIKKVKILL